MRTGELVAIKSYAHAMYRSRQHAENPVAEISAMQFLGQPGHRNVIQQLCCAEDNDFVSLMAINVLFPLVVQHYAVLQWWRSI